MEKAAVTEDVDGNVHEIDTEAPVDKQMAGATLTRV
jgi:hypothetical protein